MGHFMATSTTIISKTTQIKGDITFSGELCVDGKIIGNILVDNEKDAHLVINETGVVEGDIRVPNIIINGLVTGNVYSSKQLEMSVKGVVNGTIQYQSMQMIKGAQVNGSITTNQNDAKKPKLLGPVV